MLVCSSMLVVGRVGRWFCMVMVLCSMCEVGLEMLCCSWVWISGVVVVLIFRCILLCLVVVGVISRCSGSMVLVFLCVGVGRFMVRFCRLLDMLSLFCLFLGMVSWKW